MYYTSMQHPKFKRIELQPLKLLEDLKTPSSLYESLQSTKYCKLFFDIDYKSDQHVDDISERLFLQLNKTHQYYIYGGYTTNKGVAHKFNLTYYNKDDVPKTLSIHIVFPKIITTTHIIKQYIRNSFQTQYIFDQVVYGGHDMMRHPLYNKSDYKVACNKLIDCNGEIFNKSQPLRNIQIFIDSFITYVAPKVRKSDDEVIQDVMDVFNVIHFRGSDFVYLIPQGSVDDPVEGVYNECKKVIRCIDILDMKKIDDKERFENLRHTLLKFIGDE